MSDLSKLKWELGLRYGQFTKPSENFGNHLGNPNRTIVPVSDRHLDFLDVYLI